MRSQLIRWGVLLAILLAGSVVWGISTGQAQAAGSECVQCHSQVTPQVVEDWNAGKMGSSGMDCSACHGSEHSRADDYEKAVMPTPDTCATCHADQVRQFEAGKHAAAWVAMEAMPKTATQPKEISDGFKGCGGCHRIGYQGGKCDSCHTRHKFSAEEARRPEACQTCHMGFDHPQYEMWSSSKHGSIYAVEGDSGRAPTCQTCHMQGGDHGVLTSWGFLAVRLPEDDPDWLADRVTILKALGVLDPEGNPTARLDVVKAGNVARLTKEDWQLPREKMLATCSGCHSREFAAKNLAAGDAIVRESDRLMAEAINTVAGLYQDRVLTRQADYAYAYPDILTFYDAPTPIEQKLYEMLMEYRMRAFQGAFHQNPDYMHWYGWAPMKTTLVEIKDEAARLRAEAGAAPAGVDVTAEGARIHMVVTGDTLARLAAKYYGQASQWRRIYEANQDKIRNPNRIYPSMKLVIP